MPPIQVYPLLGLLERLVRVVGDKIWKLGIQQVKFLRFLFRRFFSLFIRRFRNLNQMSKSSGIRPSMPWNKANHDSRGVFDDVDCFSKLPISFVSGWQRTAQSLPLHHAEQRHQPVPQMGPSSTSQAVVQCSTTPTGDALVPPHPAEHCYPSEPQGDSSTSQLVVTHSITPTDHTPLRTSSSVTTRAEDDRNRDLQLPPGLSNEVLRLVGVTSANFERYERNFKSYVFFLLHTGHHV